MNDVSIRPSILDQAAEQMRAGQQAGEQQVSVCLLNGASIKPEPIRWLWEGYLAAGKLHVFGGAPGTGKTTIAMAIAAIFTSGGDWPDGTRADVGNVVIWSGEDDPADTLAPRLLLSGASMGRVYFVSDVMIGKQPRPFDPARDVGPLAQKLSEIGDVRLIIVDPIVSAVSGDSHKNAEVRRALQPLVDLASRVGAALIGITHFSKGTGGREPTERLTGSLAFGALARIVLVAATHQQAGDSQFRRIFCRAKSNIGSDTGGFYYDLRQSEVKDFPNVSSSCVVWGEAVEGAARDLLAEADSADDDSDRDSKSEAKKFLADLLADGPVSSATIFADARGAGYSDSTIRRAQKALGVVAEKIGMKQGWQWRLPDKGPPKMVNRVEDAQQKKTNIFGGDDHLRGEDLIQGEGLKIVQNAEDAEDVLRDCSGIFDNHEHLRDDDDIIEVEI